ncbi:glycine cleavage system aminomethyltransferase GcvT [Sporolactobacillus shoreae]|uniref:Aminomethyltransferase n=1 Tax=Sporolactobacillus shoreae TaxID=1465501 RepID=A0A4Z0GHY3_9BACL|nr:glycine cleavage system aminomethyltransferase GcvT [Sporolactobacillus shoreae]TGA96406.1 glycine cleavage system aminomethyltransferase GcvT [Sporolactobacillus shoreae]
MSGLKTTPLYGTYQKIGAKLIDFGGYLLPVQISGIKQEHHAVRSTAGIFDVSHMGEFSLEGADSEAFLQGMVTNDVSKAHPGDAMYTAMCYPDGGTVDDLMIYRLSASSFMLVVNAANIEKDFEWLQSHLDGKAVLKNESEKIALLAVQGPLAESVIQKITPFDLKSINHFKFEQNVPLDGIPVLISRTGYTGEDGFEIYCPWDHAEQLWNKLLKSGENEGLIPCGLGARDTLRFEARLPLYGQELSASISPLEAGIGFAVKTKKIDDFIGKTSLTTQKLNGLKRKIVGIEMIDRAIPRTHYAVYDGDLQIGEVTTGTQSPTLGKNLGLVLIDEAHTSIGTVIDIDVRGKRKKAKVVKTPFYKRS